jgi:general secretion pathway protein G
MHEIITGGNNMKTHRDFLSRTVRSVRSYVKGFRNKNPQSGTTFIEVLVTMAIIAILMTTIAIAVIVYIPQANIAKAKNDISVMRMAITSYYLGKGKFPEDGSWKTEIAPFIQDGKVPNDPWGKEYKYTIPGPEDNIDYEIRSEGPTDSADDDIISWKLDAKDEEDKTP